MPIDAPRPGRREMKTVAGLPRPDLTIPDLIRLVSPRTTAARAAPDPPRRQGLTICRVRRSSRHGSLWKCARRRFAGEPATLCPPDSTNFPILWSRSSQVPTLRTRSSSWPNYFVVTLPVKRGEAGALGTISSTRARLRRSQRTGGCCGEESPWVPEHGGVPVCGADADRGAGAAAARPLGPGLPVRSAGRSSKGPPRPVSARRPVIGYRGRKVPLEGHSIRAGEGGDKERGELDEERFVVSMAFCSGRVPREHHSYIRTPLVL
jgi:hypothetical protein